MRYQGHGRILEPNAASCRGRVTVAKICRQDRM